MGRTMILFRPHCPGFVNDGEPAEPDQYVEDLAGLQAVPQVRRFLDTGATLELSLTRPHPQIENIEHLLMAMMPDGKFWVIGYMSPADDAEALGLPIWQYPANREERGPAKLPEHVAKAIEDGAPVSQQIGPAIGHTKGLERCDFS